MEDGFIKYSKNGFVNMSDILSAEILYDKKLFVEIKCGDSTKTIIVANDYLKEWCDRFNLEFPKEEPLSHSRP